MATILDLPEEVFLIIISNLDKKTVHSNITQVCKKWYQTIRTNKRYCGELSLNYPEDSKHLKYILPSWTALQTLNLTRKSLTLVLDFMDQLYRDQASLIASESLQEIHIFSSDLGLPLPSQRFNFRPRDGSAGFLVSNHFYIKKEDCYQEPLFYERLLEIAHPIQMHVQAIFKDSNNFSMFLEKFKTVEHLQTVCQDSKPLIPIFQSCTTLSSLCLINPRETDSIARQLEEAFKTQPNIKRLELKSYSQDTLDIAQFLKFKELTTLDINMMFITNELKTNVSGYNLYSLTLASCDFDKGAWNTLIRHVPNLQRLKVIIQDRFRTYTKLQAPDFFEPLKTLKKLKLLSGQTILEDTSDELILLMAQENLCDGCVIDLSYSFLGYVRYLIKGTKAKPFIDYGHLKLTAF